VVKLDKEEQQPVEEQEARKNIPGGCQGNLLQRQLDKHMPVIDLD